MNRREFLGFAAAGIAGGAFAGAADQKAAAATPAAAKKGQVKFCLFADIHYHPGVFPNDTPEFLEKILRRAEESKVDFVLHLGDFLHNPVKYKDYADRYNDFHIPTFHTIGNHDNDGCTHEETLEVYRMKSGHYFYDFNGFRFVICDPNHVRYADGTIKHYSKGNYFKKTKDDKISYMPEEQIEWLKETLDRSPYPCVICSHQSFERERRGVPNFQAVRDVINAANRKHPGRVPFVLNGHEHIDNLRILDNILYFDFNSANYQYYGKTHDKYPAEFVKAHRAAPHTIAWTEPFSAIITMYANGRIRIEGSKADWLYGVTPVDAGFGAFEWDGTGRVTHPEVQSADITLNFGAKS